ncbi:FtsX-like permease family protein [Desulfococcaceae bacterium HSG9]|nr:FtsX-like permease family protein [Desulfococcaceae bacterium HSG9]
MIALKLAYRNLVGAGLRTWLNVGVLSFIYVLIIWHQGLFNGMYPQTSRFVIREEIAGGQYWHKNYDPFDPLAVEDSHGIIPSRLRALVRENRAAPILIRQGTIYPQGRIQPVLLKGIDPRQTVLDIPIAKLLTDSDTLPIMAGYLMAQKNGFEVGDVLTIRWRDTNGTYDAADGEIVEIMHTRVPTIDMGQLWIPLDRLQQMALLPDEATLIVAGRDIQEPLNLPEWPFKGQDFLLKDITDMIKAKRVGGFFLYAILLFLALLAVFDTQVLAVFRRRKEIGTLMALGMVRSGVIAVFTIEGALHGILAVGMAALYGIPILLFSAYKGIPIPSSAEGYGLAFPVRLFPVYSAWLVGGTILIIMLAVTIVSYLPSRKITGMKPTEVLR